MQDVMQWNINMLVFRLFIILILLFSVEVAGAIKEVDEKQVLDDLKYLVSSEMYDTYELDEYKIKRISRGTIKVYVAIFLKRNKNNPPGWVKCKPMNAPHFTLMCKQSGYKTEFDLELEYIHTRRGYMLHVPVRLKSVPFGIYLDRNKKNTEQVLPTMHWHQIDRRAYALHQNPALIL